MTGQSGRPEQSRQWTWGNRLSGGIVRSSVRDALRNQYLDELTALQQVPKYAALLL